MPKPVMAGVVLASGAGLVAALNVLIPGRLMQTLGFVVAGAAVVLLLYLLYQKVLLPLWDKRKANPFAKAVTQNAGAAPQSISDPAKRARLDDLRKAFEAGVDKYRQAGKNIYSVPWYLVVGEPGSGKTEAVRHSGIGFPPGLQDPLQGAGGTLNMNWWFSNPAVLLDTAGRLMFEEAAPGQTTEWQELLKNLNRFRPNCPINGMLLFIPADSVIRDTADAIERKAARIAAQLDATQRALGIRFPVFVIISKCDLINGFRDFFDSVDDPSLQHQMMGWSNPASLDTPFRPEMVEDYLAQVRDRLIRRRQVMLEDPVNTEDAAARRADQVDALFSFPESLMQIAPRLRKYLEMIFVSGEWSSKPLFPRGIYFTSSMREGSALDAELAEALGVSIESLPEGKVWERERAYFLRDLFMSKIFKEKGLVTRAGNVRKAQQRRRAILLGSGVVTALVLIGLTAFSTLTYKSGVGQAISLWQGLADETEGAAAGTARAVEYVSETREAIYQATKPDIYKDGRDLISRLEEVKREVENEKIQVPMIFRFASGITGDIEQKRERAARSYFVGTVIRPVIEAALKQFDAHREKGEPWTAASTLALAQLVRAATIAERGPGVVSKAREMLSLDPLYRFALTPAPGALGSGSADAIKQYEDRGRTQFQQVQDALFAQPESWQNDLRSALSAREVNRLDDAKGPITSFVDSWDDQASGKTGELGLLSALRGSMQAFDAAEIELLRINQSDDLTKRPLRDMSAYQERLEGPWVARYPAVEGARTRLMESARAARAEEGKSGSALRERAQQAVTEEARKQFKLVRDEAGPGEAPRGSEALAARSKRLAEAWAKVEDGVKNAAASLAGDGESGFDALVARHLSRIDGAGPPLAFERRVDAYRSADTLVTAARNTPPLAFGEAGGQLGAAMSDSAKAADHAVALLGGSAAAKVDAFVRAESLVNAVARLATGARLHRTIDAALRATPESAERIASAVAATVTPEMQTGEENTFPSIPMTAMQGGPFASEFHPRAAKRALEDWAAVDAALTPTVDPSAVYPLDARTLAERAKPARDRWMEYAQSYVRHWASDVPLRRARIVDQGWPEFHANVGNVRADILKSRSGVVALWQRMREAIAAVPDATGGKGRADALAQLDAEIKILRDGATWDAASDAMKKWMDLGSAAETARESMLNVSCDDLRARYFVSYPSRERDSEGGRMYWNAVFLAGLTALGNDTQRNASEALANLTDKAAAFPVCRDLPSARVMSGAEVREALRWARILPRTDAGNDGKISQGCETDRAQIDERLRRLTGKGFLDKSGEEWLRRVRAVLEFLGEQERITCEVLRPSAAAQGEFDSGFSFMAFESQVDLGDAAGPRPFWRRVADDQQPTLASREWTVQIPSDRGLKFITTISGGSRLGEVSLAAPWSVVALLHDPRARNDPSDPTAVLAPVTYSSGGKDYSLLVRLKFSKKVPDLSKWPNWAEWRKPGQAGGN
ncbi:MAG: hypothetical protein JNM80_05460 [Phycisphaerae bacterium]|nr:hypothetical protein [Phycisphaerae bacterium]